MEGTKRSAGVIVVREADGGWKVLLLRAFRYWDFPKGEVEPGETPFAAACREVAEEAGIRELEFRWGHGYHETPPYGRGKVARYYLACTPETRVSLTVNPALGRPEHHEARWLDFAAARKRLVPRVAAALDWAESVLGGAAP